MSLKAVPERIFPVTIFLDAPLRLNQTAFLEGFLCDERLAFDATHFEARDASKPSEKKEAKLPKKRGRKAKEVQSAWLAELTMFQLKSTTVLPISFRRLLNSISSSYMLSSTSD